jgi:hypothetical protein
MYALTTESAVNRHSGQLWCAQRAGGASSGTHRHWHCWVHEGGELLPTARDSAAWPCQQRLQPLQVFPTQPTLQMSQCTVVSQSGFAPGNPSLIHMRRCTLEQITLVGVSMPFGNNARTLAWRLLHASEGQRRSRESSCLTTCRRASSAEKRDMQLMSG